MLMPISTSVCHTCSPSLTCSHTQPVPVLLSTPTCLYTVILSYTRSCIHTLHRMRTLTLTYHSRRCDLFQPSLFGFRCVLLHLSAASLASAWRSLSFIFHAPPWRGERPGILPDPPLELAMTQCLVPRALPVCRPCAHRSGCYTVTWLIPRLH